MASARSFAAVSQESFYVGISRARERARVYTDDAELLGRRVQDAHTRKAAVELAGLREALQRAGLAHTPEPPPRRADNVVAPREAQLPRVQGLSCRPWRTLRVERLAPVQRLAQWWTHSVREWLDERFGSRIERTTRETLRPQIIQQPDASRQSRGIRM